MEPEMIKRFLEIYEPGEELTKPDETLLNFGRQMLPPEIMYLWENYGFGDYGNGLLKVVDPRDYMSSLYTWIGGQDFSKIPIMVTAFGDIFYYRKLDDTENDIALLNIHFDRIDVCTYSYQEFFEDYIIEEDIKEGVLRESLYNEALDTLGPLTHDEIFFFVPALALGGGENIKYIKKGDANVHQQLLFDLMHQ